MPTDEPEVEQDWSVAVQDGRLVIGGEVEVNVLLHDPQGDPTPLPDGEKLLIEHPGDGLIDGQPCAIYSPEGRPEDRPAVTVQLDSLHGGANDE